MVNNDVTGPCVMWDRERCFCYMLNHFEYEVRHHSRAQRREVDLRAERALETNDVVSHLIALPKCS